MMAEIEPSPAATSDEQARRVPKWLLILAALVLVGAVVGVIVYGYLARPRWVGVADKKFWDYLDLLIVPPARPKRPFLGVLGSKTYRKTITEPKDWPRR